MGLTRKSKMEKYWSQNGTINTPFFGKYMSKNTFQLILGNVHINDNAQYIPNGQPHHDPLFKVRPFLDMCVTKFRTVYAPKRDLSFDEGCCPFKGRLKFRVYNPAKPNKFHIKIYQVNESSSGYVVGMEIYCGKNGPTAANSAVLLDPKAGKTTKLVVGLLQSVNLLHKGYHVYMDNYYSSVELYEELYYFETYACGTVRKDRVGLPIAVKEAKLKKGSGDCVFRRKGPLLAIKWCQKRSVFMISTIHEAMMKDTGKTNYRGDRVIKPEPVCEYIKKMGGVDLGDQMMSYYSFMRRSKKWWKKLFIHLINMVLLNAFILNNKFGDDKIAHEDFRQTVVEYLIEEGAKNCNLTLPPIVSRRGHYEQRLTERHFPSFIPSAVGAKRTKPSRPCFVCSSLPHVEGVRLSKKWSSYWCGECKKVLCIDYCFRLYHTSKDFKTEAMDYRISQLRN